MKYPEFVRYKKSEINRAGDTLISKSPRSKEYIQALSIVISWRTSHSYVMNTFDSTLRKKTRNNKDVIIAQRLKRLPTIINKLKRFDSMKLSRMQDVGGVRAVLNNIKEVRALENEYVSSGRFTHKLKMPYKDYIKTPKEDGYRGVHLVYEYNNTLARNNLAQKYNGLLIEVQIRTGLQHEWATAVETMGAYLGESFKNGKGSEKWREFFALASSTFAYTEDTPFCPQHQGLNILDVLKRLKKLDGELEAIEHMNAISLAAKLIHDNLHKSRKRHAYYNLISLDMEKRIVKILSFRRDELDAATKEYTELEKRGSRFDQVLVSVNSLIPLKKAYPNYFLDMSNFTKRIKIIIEELSK